MTMKKALKIRAFRVTPSRILAPQGGFRLIQRSDQSGPMQNSPQGSFRLIQRSGQAEPLKSRVRGEMANKKLHPKG